jgi:outer membrane immunogenic protein
MRKSLIVIAATAILGGSPVLAADMALKAPAPPVSAVYNWTGWYLGGNLGGKWGSTSDTVNFAPNAVLPGGASLGLPTLDTSSFIGGGQIGYNWQVGRIVYGLEVDADGQNLNANQTLTAFSLGTLFVPGDSFSVRSNWEASLRGRLGYAWDRALIYATGGLALTGVRVSSNFVVFGVDPATAGSDNEVLVGGTLGAGLDYAVTNKVSIGVEGRYTWYGTHTFNTGTVALGFPPVFDNVTQTVGLQTGEVVAKLNYHF